SNRPMLPALIRHLIQPAPGPKPKPCATIITRYPGNCAGYSAARVGVSTHSRPHNQNRGAPQCLEVRRRLMTARKLAIVVEGGGLRGSFCAGALQSLAQVLPRNPDYIFATSSGAPSAAFFALGNIDRAIHLWEHWTHASHLISPRHLLHGRPIMDVDKLVSRFRGAEPLEVERLGDVPTQTFVAVTHCRAGQAEY